MKTTEIIKMTDEALTVDKLWKEQSKAIYKRVEEEKKAFKQRIEELENSAKWNYFVAANPEAMAKADKAFEKAMAFFRTVDNDKVKITVKHYEDGVLTALETMNQFRTLTLYASIAIAKALDPKTEPPVLSESNF